MTTRPKKFTEKELAAINQLRKNVRDLELDEERNSDSQLVRWLIVQNFDVKKAEQMLRKSIIWWKENDIDRIMEWTAPEEIQNSVPLRVCGYDLDGNTVMIAQMKEVDPSIIMKLNKHDFIKYRVQSLLKAIGEMKVRNKRLSLPGDQFIIINDLDGFSLKSVINTKMLNLAGDAAHTLEDNFPEIIKMGFITHAPKMITYFMFLVKPLVPKSAVARLKIFDSDLKKWAPEILKHIPASQLPPKYGGTNIEFENTLRAPSRELSVHQ